MNIKINFDKTNIKISPTGKIELLDNDVSPGKSALFEINLDFLYMAYQLFPPRSTCVTDITNSFMDFIQRLASNCIYKERKVKTYENIEGKPGVIPATGNDVYNYIARYGMANFQIQVVMKLNGRLDRSRLIKAVRLSVDAEPVFGCRFVENHPPYWKRLDNIDKVRFCTFEETYNPDEAIKRFVESPLDMDNDPMVKLRLISCGQYDTLCLKINHTCCDGTGTKEYINLLSDIYSRLGQNNGVFVPKPRTRSRKDQDRLFEALGIKDPESAWTGELEKPRNMFAFPWQPGRPVNPCSAVCKLPPGIIEKMSKYAKSRDATINDLILTALYRAMFEMSQPKYGVPIDIAMTVDLRRYLPDHKTEAIRNFSGGVNTRLARLANESFEDTLSRVVPMMNKIKNSRPGLQSAIGLERVEKGDFHQTTSYYRTLSQLFTLFAGCIRQCTPVLSNLGFLEKSLIKFGNVAVTDAYIIPPALCAPGLLFCVGTYNDVMTISVSYYEPQVQRCHIERLLLLIRKELIDNCAV